MQNDYSNVSALNNVTILCNFFLRSNNISQERLCVVGLKIKKYLKFLKNKNSYKKED